MCVWQSEKLPLDVLSLVYEKLFQHRCLCGRWYAHEVKHPDIVASMKTCRRWRLGWNRMILRCLSTDPFPLCARPENCLKAYKQMHSLHPFLVLQGGHRAARARRRDETEGGEAGGRRIPGPPHGKGGAIE